MTFGDGDRRLLPPISAELLYAAGVLIIVTLFLGRILPGGAPGEGALLWRRDVRVLSVRHNITATTLLVCE